LEHRKFRGSFLCCCFHKKIIGKETSTQLFFPSMRRIQATQDVNNEGF
jgi:hypothetical protein